MSVTLLIAFLGATSPAHACSCVSPYGVVLPTDGPMPVRPAFLLRTSLLEEAEDVTLRVWTEDGSGAEVALTTEVHEAHRFVGHSTILQPVEPLEPGERYVLETGTKGGVEVSVAGETDAEPPGAIRLRDGKDDAYNSSGGGDCGDRRWVYYEIEPPSDPDLFLLEHEVTINDVTETWFEETFDDMDSVGFGTGDCSFLTELDRGDVVELRLRAVDTSGNRGPWSDWTETKINARMSLLPGCSTGAGTPAWSALLLAAALVVRRRR
jgi:uncharacterized protein (TIGR03382 family)